MYFLFLSGKISPDEEKFNLTKTKYERARDKKIQ